MAFSFVRVRGALMLSLAVLFLVSSRSGCFAVDRSKFRTCDQTSFCRRNRRNANRRFYEYKLLPESIRVNGDDGGDGKNENEKAEGSSSSVWKSLQRRLLGSDNNQNGGAADPYVRGPPASVTGVVFNVAPETSSGSHEELLWSVTCLANGIARIRLTEHVGVPGSAHEQPRVTYDSLVLDAGDDNEQQWQPADKVQVLRDGPVLRKLVPKGESLDKYVGIEYGQNSGSNSADSMHYLLVQLQPLAIGLYDGNDLQNAKVILGAEQMMHFETRRHKDGRPDEDTGVEKNAETKKHDKEVVGYWEDGLAIYADGTREERQKQPDETEDHRKLAEDGGSEEEKKDDNKAEEGLWDERFGEHHDTKPLGPMSVGMDIRFPQSPHLYGIPEHADRSFLQTTTGPDAHFSEPYRLYNLDVFEYELDETMALYGHVPLVISQNPKAGGTTTGVFWFNPTETFVDVAIQDETALTHWISESGIVDVFLMPGPDPATVYEQYASLTGTTPTPPIFALGYHQCRWNYKDEQDVYNVHGKFEELDYPYDVLWLDIEHTDGKRYFTWDSNLFPNPIPMQEKLASQGRRMVTIVDPHIFRDDNYYVHKEATSKGLYIKKNDGKTDYDGWCWPGSSSYLDFTDATVRQWWGQQFAYDKYQGSTPTLFTWNDMNEPSVFNGPEVSMQKDLKNLAGEEHREWHNLYGMLFHRATGEGQIMRSPNQDTRPFVLSRAFFAGSQKYGAIWTGDNTAEWGHLEIAAPMLLSLNTAALSFVGADVGGFFGNPDAELFTRWMQAGAYQPFFRGHAHHDAKRREPWMYGEETMQRLRKASMVRYALLPMWYTVFHTAETTGMPVMRMMWMQYPHTAALMQVDEQYLIGADLLVVPVTKQGATEAQVRFPSDDLWYDAESLVLASNRKIKAGAVETKMVPADIDTIPVYQRGGSILFRKLRLRRSTMAMKSDPYTLYVALDANRKAQGELYMDDEESFGYTKRQEFASATTVLGSNGKLTNTVQVGAGWSDQISVLAKNRMVERIVLLGVAKSPKKISLDGGSGPDLTFSFRPETNTVVIRKPEVSALEEWTIVIA